MPRRRDVQLPLAGVTTINARDESTFDLGQLQGVHVMVLMRHRH